MSKGALVKYRQPSSSQQMGNKDGSIAEKIANLLIKEKLENGEHTIHPYWRRIGGAAAGAGIGAGVAGHIANEYQDDSNGNVLVNPTTGAIISTAAGFGGGGLAGVYTTPQYSSSFIASPNGQVRAPNATSPFEAELLARRGRVRRGVTGAMVGSTGMALMNLAGSLSDRPDEVFEEDTARARNGAILAAAGGLML